MILRYISRVIFAALAVGVCYGAFYYLQSKRNPLDSGVSSKQNQPVGEKEVFHKWTDADGTVHFTRDKPSIASELVSVDPQANILQTPKYEEKRKEKSGTAVLISDKPSSPYTPSGAQELIENARNVEKVLEQRNQQMERY